MTPWLWETDFALALTLAAGYRIMNQILRSEYRGIDQAKNSVAVGRISDC